jgi:lipopolysaccharide transport system permease protein
MKWLKNWVSYTTYTTALQTYKTLLWSIIRTEFQNKYKTRRFGMIWAILEPLFMIGILLLVFTKLFDYQNPRFPEYIVVGFFVWEFFETATRSGLMSIYTNAQIIRKHSFPKLIVVLSNTLVSFIDFLFKFVALIMILVAVSWFQDFNRVLLNWNILLLPLLMFLLLLLIFGINLILSLVFVKFRDLENIWGILMRVGFFATPIVYPRELLPAQYQIIQSLNPVLYPMTLFRQILLDPAHINYVLFLPTLAFTAVFLGIGGYLFFKFAKKLPEWV